MRSDSSKHSSDMDVHVPKYIFNFRPLKKIEELKFVVFNSEKNVKEIDLYFNYFSKESFRDSQDSFNESLS